LGVLIIILGLFGYSAAKQRNIKGHKVKGNCMLIIYVTILGAVILTLLGIGIALFVWMGGTVPSSGYDKIDQAAHTGLEKSEKPIHNFVGCVYDVCCFQKIKNASTFTPVVCKMDNDGVPDVNGEEIFNAHTNISAVDNKKFKGAARSCSRLKPVLSKETCTKGSYAFRQAVGKWINNKVRPFAIAIVTLFGMILTAWILAFLEIFWCCGPGDEEDEEDDDYGDDDGTKIYPSEDNYDY
jgi:hypothetical protein